MMGQAMFEHLPNPLPVARYHSSLARKLYTEQLIVNAWCDNTVMTVRHRQHRTLWFQFHRINFYH